MTLFNRFLLTLLIIDGALCAIVASLYLPLYLNGSPAPLSAVAAAVMNIVLVLAASSVATTTLARCSPLIAWILTFGLGTSAGPGGDVVFTSGMQTRVVLLAVAALLPAGLVLVRRSVRGR